MQIQKMSYKPNMTESEKSKFIYKFLELAFDLIEAKQPLTHLFADDFPPKLQERLIEKANSYYQFVQREKKFEQEIISTESKNHLCPNCYRPFK